MENEAVTCDQLLDAIRTITAKYPICVPEKRDFLNLGCNADYVAVTSAGQVYEYEIKKSRSDYLRDPYKRRHRIYSSEDGRKPNRFWYVTAPSVVRDDLPNWAGLYELGPEGLVEVVKAPLMWRGTHEIKRIMQVAGAMKCRGH